MGLQQSVQSVDNESWVQENLHYLDINDPAKTYKYVVVNHPLHGCAFAKFDMPDKKSEIKDLAKHADAATVACYEFIGNAKPYKDLADDEIKLLNQTAIGNISYIAMKHSNEEIKKEFTKIIEKWKKLS